MGIIEGILNSEVTPHRCFRNVNLSVFVIRLEMRLVKGIIVQVISSVEEEWK